MFASINWKKIKSKFSGKKKTLSSAPKTNRPYHQDHRFLELYQSMEVIKPNEAKLQEVFNLIQFFKQTLHLEGDVVECGCFKGLSAFMMLHALKDEKPDYMGENFHIFDSFEGLSSSSSHDGTKDRSGDFCASLEEVRIALNAFPKVTFHKGWIPDSFVDLPALTCKFVYLDLDLHDPTLHSLKTLYPQLRKDGILMIDDYGKSKWPGIKKAVDDFCVENHIRPIALSTGQAVILKK